MTNQTPESVIAEARGFWGSETREYTEGLVSRLADALEAAEARVKELEAATGLSTKKKQNQREGRKMNRILTGVVLAVAVFVPASPALADVTISETDPIEVVEEITDPDWDTQPEWAYEWRDREYRPNCNADGTGERTVWQSMWRPSEPTWDGAEWVTYDDWAEWAWPEAMQAVYKPLEPGDCETVPGEAPASTDGDTDGDPGVLAETGFDVLPLAAVGIGLLAAGVFLAVLARRKEMG